MTGYQHLLDEAVRCLSAELGKNLYSCCVYGSIVRGNYIEGVSDINLLIVLNQSAPEAHEAVACAIGAVRQIDPFILGRDGFPRSARAFAAKFASIKRNYRVLCGADPLADLPLDPVLEKFLCEQALRNLRLRLVYVFVTRQRNKSYHKFLTRSVTPLFVQASEALRLEGRTIPKEFEARIGLLEKEFGIDGAVWRDLLAFKEKPHNLSDPEIVRWQERLFPLIDAVVRWLETKWVQE